MASLTRCTLVFIRNAPRGLLEDYSLICFTLIFISLICSRRFLSICLCLFLSTSVSARLSFFPLCFCISNIYLYKNKNFRSFNLLTSAHLHSTHSLSYFTPLCSALLYLLQLYSDPFYSLLLLLRSPLLSTTIQSLTILYSFVLSSAQLHSRLISSTLFYSSLLYPALLDSTLFYSLLLYSLLLLLYSILPYSIHLISS